MDAIAAQQPERIDADGAHLREFSATLHAMQTMGRELTDSLQSQWRMEQQRAEQIAALTHDLKTPLSIIQGNADLLAEDALSADQQTQVEAILRGTDRAQQYLAALRTACAPPAAGKTFPSHTLVSELAETARALCAPAGVQLILNEQWQGTLCAAQCDLLRAAENLLDNAVRYTPRGGTVTLLVTKEKQDFILRVTDTGPGFTAGGPRQRRGSCSTPTPPAVTQPTRAWGCILHEKSRNPTAVCWFYPTFPLRTVPVPSCACRFANSA